MESDDSVASSDFAELLSRAAAGDAAAQELICQRYERQVRIMARVLLGPQLRSHLDSMDLLQSVHKSLLIGLRNEKFSIASSEKLIALACVIVRRKVARKWRTHRRQLHHGRSPNGDSLYVSNLLSSITNHHASPDQIADYNDKLSRLCNALPEIERKMLEMRLDGYTTGEVAQHLGLHPVAIRVRWTRLRQRLHESEIFADWL